jgi:hypothetical protein
MNVPEKEAKCYWESQGDQFNSGNEIASPPLNEAGSLEKRQSSLYSERVRKDICSLLRTAALVIWRRKNLNIWFRVLPLRLAVTVEFVRAVKCYY